VVSPRLYYTRLSSHSSDRACQQLHTITCNSRLTLYFQPVGRRRRRCYMVSTLGFNTTVLIFQCNLEIMFLHIGLHLCGISCGFEYRGILDSISSTLNSSIPLGPKCDGNIPAPIFLAQLSSVELHCSTMTRRSSLLDLDLNVR
jgi:hypothetical protein